MNHTALVIFFVTVFLSTQTAFADSPQTPFIEVMGSSELKVVPDQFALHVNVVKFHKNVDRAAKNNTDQVVSLTNAMRKLGVERKYVVSSEISVRSITEGYRERGTFKHLGYSVSRDVRVVLHDPKRIQTAMKTIFKTGIDSLRLTYHHTKIADLQKKVEIEAIQSAKAKAARMTSALGVVLGAPLEIEERSPSSSAPTNFTYSANTPDLGAGLSLGKITVAQTLRVKFRI